METDSNPDAHASLIISFCEIISATYQEALFFLGSHNFGLDAAVSSFLDNGNDHNITGGTNVVANDNVLLSPAHLQYSPSPTPSEAPTALGMAPKNPSGSGTGGIRTLSDLKRPAPDSARV